MRNSIFIIAVMLSLLLGAIASYVLYPHNITKEVAVDKIVYVDKVVTVEKPVEKIVYKEICSGQPSHYTNQEPNVAYVEEDGIIKEAGSSYSNKPSECARLHNRSLC